MNVERTLGLRTEAIYTCLYQRQSCNLLIHEAKIIDARNEKEMIDQTLNPKQNDTGKYRIGTLK